ncbi:DUF421 domain-containing protein [Bacillus marinisedimentorum]|uniref:DUF421 domain-containing protein n=1 Tax=Bacillus marinisedimentorum TaxID=1821260 RepID=UPI0008728ED2|nr:DUF421 domain-containing protein [Bacillus marinisedimentorum]
MDLTMIGLRTLLLYAVIVLIFRLMGKREIGELSIIDLVVFIMLAEIAVLSIEDPKVPLINTFIPMAVLLMLQFSTSYLSLKSKTLRDILDGRPTVLIENGKIREKEMKKQRYNFNDLLVQLREQQVKDIADVEFAILEPSGKLSVFEKEQSSSDDQSKKTVVDFPVPLIVDGKVSGNNLKRAKRDLIWLRETIRQEGFDNIEDVSYCSIDEQGNIYIDEKDEKKT